MYTMDIVFLSGGLYLGCISCKSFCCHSLCQKGGCPSLERREFLPFERSKSRIWEHFGFLACDGKYCEPDKKKHKLVYCKVCECSCKYCGNTMNMHYHLKEHHPILYKMLSDCDSSSNSSSTHVASVPCGQQKLPELFKQQEALAFVRLCMTNHPFPPDSPIY